MLIKNWGAAWALTGLISLVAVAFLLFDTPHCYYNKSGCINQDQHSTADKDRSGVFVSLPNWAASNREAIDGLATIGSLIFAGVLALFTGVLAKKTSGLYRETAALRSVADQQRDDMLRSIAAAEKSAEAAREAASIVPNLERAFVYVADMVPTIGEPEKDIDKRTREVVDRVKRSSIEVSFVNYGRTPANVASIVAFADFLDHVPNESDDKPIIESATAVARQRLLRLSVQINHGLLQLGLSQNLHSMPCRDLSMAKSICIAGADWNTETFSVEHTPRISVEN